MKFAELREKLDALPRGPYEECRGAEKKRACRCGHVWAVADDVCLLSTNTNSPDEGIEFFTTEQIGRHSETLAALLNALPELLQLEDENAALRREVSEAEAKGYRRGLERAMKACEDLQSDLEAHKRTWPDASNGDIEAGGALAAQIVLERLIDEDAPDTEAGDRK